jgi:phage repressor protein C with HTH and peptisase S24 domain
MGVSAESLGWIKVEKNRKLDRNMFVARVTGRSMEPRIKDGDYCIFRTNVVGSRNNKIVLVQHNSISDPETGGKYTVKKYSSRKKYSTDGTWTHEEIILLPLNPNYSPLTIMDSDEGEFMVIAQA